MSERKLQCGEIAVVLSPTEILSTLDSNGTLDNLPFMPEMLQYCGAKYKVTYRIEKTCVECLRSNYLITTMREFALNDVVFLEELRCSGTFHGNCQVGCMIFWKEKWLKKMNNNENTITNEYQIEELLTHLKNKSSNNRYFCQSTQLAYATIHISSQKRFIKLIKEIIRGDITIFTGLNSIIKPLVRKIKKMRIKKFIKSNLDITPFEALNLLPGENVEVKSFSEILKTLDHTGKNKGLGFTYGMRDYCGKKMKVRNRLENMISETTGEMRVVKNTVILEDAACTYDYKGFGCPRLRFRFWREIWLKRI